MVLISHRGNIDGRNPEFENTQDYIDDAIESDYEVEIDVWSKDGNLWLGHDMPQRRVEYDWLLARRAWLWIHCKNFKALAGLITSPLVLFYHSKEDYTLLSNGMVWAHNIHEIDHNCVIPLLDADAVIKWKESPQVVGGVCSDYISLLDD